MRQRKLIEPSLALVNDDAVVTGDGSPVVTRGLRTDPAFTGSTQRAETGVTTEPSACRAVTLTGKGTPATPAPATGLVVSTFENGTRRASTA